MTVWNACVAISVLMAASAFGQRPEKPNFVILLADDLGWQDVKCYDIEEQSVFETPYMDRLASEGLRFTQGYSPAPTCGPSRVGILSGKFPARAGNTSLAALMQQKGVSEGSPAPTQSGKRAAGYIAFFGAALLVLRRAPIEEKEQEQEQPNQKKRKRK